MAAVVLRSLRYTADLDASKYDAGMRQKIAADKAGAASSREVGQAIQQTDQKVSDAANGITRLMRQYIQGYAAEQRFEQALRTLQRAFDTGNVSAERAEQILIGLHGRYGMTANAASLMENGQHQLAGAVTKANAVLAAQEAQATQTAGAMSKAAAANDNWQRRTLRFQMFDIGQGLPLLFQSPVHGMLNLANQGAQIAQMYGPEEGGMARGFKEAAAMAGTVVTKLAPLAAVAAAGSAAVFGLQQEIQASTGVAVSFGDVFWGVIEATANGIYSLLQPAINAIAPWFAAAWDLILQGTKTSVNSFVRLTLIGIEWIKTSVKILPDAFTVAGEAAAQGFVNAIYWMRDQAISVIDFISGKLNLAFEAMGSNVRIPEIGIPTGTAPIIDLGGKGASARMKEAASGLYGRMKEIGSFDYAGAAYDAIADEAVENWRDRQKVEKAKRTPREKRTEYDRDLASVRDRIEALKAERDSIGLTEAETARLTITRQLEASAMKDSIGLSPKRIAEIKKEADAYASVVQQIEDAKKAEEQRQFMRDTVRGFIDDLRSGLEQGKTFWESFANAAVNALDRITDKLLDDVLDAIFQVNGAGRGSGGGSGILGMLGGLLGLGGGAFPSAPAGGMGASINGLWAKGGAFSGGNVIPFARGGVVSQPTIFPMARGAGLMGEAGPEAIMPLRRTSSGHLGVMASGSNDNLSPSFHFSPTFHASGNEVTDRKALAELKKVMDQDFTPKVLRALKDIKRRGLAA